MSLLGSCLTVFLLQRLISDWNSYPMYTMIDNSAADIGSVPFPSVTVCQGNGHPAPSGGWAFPKKALDLFRIGYAKNKTVEFTKFGQRFKKFVDFAGTTILNRYLKYLESNEDNYDLHDDQVAQISKGSKNQLSFKEFTDIGEKVLMHNYTESSALSFVREVELVSMYEDSIIQYLKRNVAKRNCHLEGKDNLLCIYFMKNYLIPPYSLLIRDISYLGIEDGYGLGTLLSVFFPLMDSGSFIRSFSGKNAYMTCNNMGPLENELHDILTEMAHEIGIGDVSLFELPALLESHGKPMSIEKTWVDTYPNTACKQLGKTDVPYFKQITCDMQWGKFILKGTNNNFIVANPEDYQQNMTNPCQQVNGTCCPLKKLKTSNQLSKVMSVMKYASRRGNSHYSINEVLGILKTSSYAGWEQRLRPVMKEMGLYPDLETFMPYCQLQRGGNRLMVTTYGIHLYYPECDIATPVVTNKGLCYGFNAVHPKNLLNISPFRQAIGKAFKSELLAHKLHSAFGGENEQGLVFFLDKQRVLSPEQLGDIVTDVGHFSVSINNLANSFNIKSHVSRVRTGFQTEIEVSVREISVSQGVNTCFSMYSIC